MGDGQGHQAKPEEVHEHRDCRSAFVETVECYRVEKHQPAEEKATQVDRRPEQQRGDTAA